MTVYRKHVQASSAIHVETFPTYDEALTYSRSIGGHKPMRRVLASGLAWSVVRPAPVEAISDARYITVDDMVKASPAVPESVIMAALAQMFERMDEPLEVFA